MTARRFSVLKTIFPARVIQWSGPLLTAAGAAIMLAMLIAWWGVLNLAASVPHPEGWARFLHYTFKQSTTYHARSIAVPADFGTAAQIEKGAVYFDRSCSHCHGGPGLGQNPVALSMRPQPQYLVNAVGQFSPAELFWIVKHGVKYSAMPSWPVDDRDDEVWSLVSFIKKLPRMTQATYRKLIDGAADRGTAMPGTPAGADGSRRYVLGQTSPLDPSYRLTSPAIGFDGLQDGPAIGQMCIACHGSDGAGRSGGAIPNIALLKRDTIVKALTSYATGVRHSGFMQTVAVQLTPSQINALADYYARQPKRQSVTPTTTAATLALGERISVAGLPAKRIGACANCHDESKAAAKAFPSIDGQYPLYLRDQMRLFRSGVRGGTAGLNPMFAEAHRLSDSEIDAVALFYASRAPMAPIKAAPHQVVALAQRKSGLSTAK